MTGPRSPFDALADDYDAARPDYPAELYERVTALAGRDWPGIRAVDVGAGTGIASRAMRDRGASVVAVDLGLGMLRRLRARPGAPPAVVGRAERLPLRDGVAQLVTCAQAWHWVDVPSAAAEAVRVLGPDGALAVWWNDVAAQDAQWWQDQQVRLARGNPSYRPDYRARDHGAELSATGLFRAVRAWTGSWSRDVDLATYERWLRSKSYVAALGPALEDFIAAERASLSSAFADGVVHEPFEVRLWVALP